MDLGPQVLLRHAVTHNTPLKLRTTFVPTTGKAFKAENVNQDLLVELEGATINKSPFENNSHYILAQCNQISPSMNHLPRAPAGTPLKITSLEHQNQVIYDGHWDTKEIPHILRASLASSGLSRWSRKNARLRRESIHRVIPGTSLEESIKGTFLPTAGTEEESSRTLSGDEPIASPKPIPTGSPETTTSGFLLSLQRNRSAAKCARFWSSEALCKPVKDNMMTLKPDLILREKPRSVIIGPQPEFSWNGVISFLELMSSTYQDSVGTVNVRNAIMRKAYAVFAFQPGQQFLFALSIAKQEFRAHMFDCAGVVHSRGYNIH
ncbi:hypothetical protein OG21DRAFT_1491350 [Imleria badia]|nr:hypothetical protein OG21DRAFT_1491350 [Imleria badia]